MDGLAARGFRPRVGGAPQSPALRPLLVDECGVVYVEFLLAFIPLFVLVLGVSQLAFIATAKVVVEHAAWRAARSAIVVLEDDPHDYGEIPRGYYLRQTSRHIEDLGDVLSAMSVEQQPDDDSASDGQSVFSSPGSFISRAFGSFGNLGADTRPANSRMSKIRAAAYVPLLPLASTDRTGTNQSLRSAIHSDFFDRIESAIAMTRAVSTVTLHTSPDSESPAPEPIGRASPVTARVVYLFSCDVPVARQLMCHSLAWLRKRGEAYAVKALSQAENASEQSRLLPEQGQFAILVGKATLLNQGAGYQHEGE